MRVDLTGAQDAKLREAKVWRRQVANRGARMRRKGKKIPDELTVIGRARSVSAVVDHLTTMTALFEANLGSMGKARAAQLLEKGKRIAVELGKADADQEVARLAALPQKVRDFYAAKGLLYIGLKMLNDAGHELHANDPQSAAAYNLRILHRRGPAGRSTKKTVSES